MPRVGIHNQLRTQAAVVPPGQPAPVRVNSA
jgi:hypothetical protein